MWEVFLSILIGAPILASLLGFFFLIAHSQRAFEAFLSAMVIGTLALASWGIGNFIIYG